jgi:hypothetical protein
MLAFTGTLTTIGTTAVAVTVAPTGAFSSMIAATTGRRRAITTCHQSKQRKATDKSSKVFHSQKHLLLPCEDNNLLHIITRMLLIFC